MKLEIGDRITLAVELDDEPREVDVPAELAAALAADRQAAATYAGLSFTHRKEYATWVGSAKQAETRTRRADKAVAMLREGRRTPD